MLDRFIEYIKSEGLLEPDNKVLLAVSGGIDSVVMADLFKRFGYDFGIAHCNFQLRGKDSDKDEEFTRKLAKKLDVPFYLKKFNTTKYADKNGVSIQVAARELRYKWFNSLVNEKEYDVYATAHHLDDQIETFFINLLRGTGISGLHGILPKQDKCIRPLLFATRNELGNYLKKNELPYREDVSNLSDDYLRNKLRHKLIPVIEELNPSFREIFNMNIKRFRGAEKIYHQNIERIKKQIIHTDEQAKNVFIQIDGLLNLSPLKTYLHEILSPYNFNLSTIENIIYSLNEIPGKSFESGTHKLIKDRDILIISAIEEKMMDEDYLIERECSEIKTPINLSITYEKFSSDYIVPEDENIACLDLEKLTFPLKIRSWKEGDSFKPLGMKKMKKLSDYFIDEKFSLEEKSKTWLLISGNEICSVIGHRIDDRYKITESTKKICKIAYKE